MLPQPTEVLGRGMRRKFKPAKLGVQKKSPSVLKEDYDNQNSVAQLAHLRKSIAEIIQEVVMCPKQTPNTRIALLHDISNLCCLFGQKQSNDILLPIVPALLNDRVMMSNSSLPNSTPSPKLVSGLISISTTTSQLRRVVNEVEDNESEKASCINNRFQFMGASSTLKVGIFTTVDNSTSLEATEVSPFSRTFTVPDSLWRPRGVLVPHLQERRSALMMFLYQWTKVFS